VHQDRLSLLASFLANLVSPAIDISTPRPEPKTSETLLVNAFLRRMSAFAGGKDPTGTEQELRKVFLRHVGMEQRLDEIWNRYGSNESFFAFLSTIAAETTKHARKSES